MIFHDLLLLILAKYSFIIGLFLKTLIEREELEVA